MADPAPLVYVLESYEGCGDPWFAGVFSTARRARDEAERLGHGEPGREVGYLILGYRLDGPDVAESTASIEPPPRPPRPGRKPRSDTPMAHGSAETRDTLRSTFQAAAKPGKPKPSRGGKAPKAAPPMPKGGKGKGKGGKAC